METDTKLPIQFKNDLNKVKEVIRNKENKHTHLRGIVKYINLFFKKWNSTILLSHENQIISLQNELIKRLT